MQKEYATGAVSFKVYHRGRGDIQEQLNGFFCRSCPYKTTSLYGVCICYFINFYSGYESYIATRTSDNVDMKIRATLFLGIALFLIATIIVSCAGGAKVKKRKYECSPRVTEAIKKYEKKKYSSVKSILDDVLVQCAGSSVADTAQYYLGMALLKMKLHLEAKVEFTRLMQDYPNSSYYEEALFRIAYAVFKGSRHMERDQTETREAYRLFRDFLENYSSSPFADSSRKYMNLARNKLAKKEYAAAEFYQKIGEKEAAIVSYRTFINEYPGSDYTALARLNMGRLLLEIKRTQEAKEVLDELISQEKKGDLVKKARGLRAQIKE